jgi:hypothetical protein
VARRPPPLEPVDLEEEEVFDPRQDDDGSPGRMIAVMVGIVGILLLGSLFWSAVGALFGALGAATEAVPISRSAPGFQLAAEPTSVPVATPTLLPVRFTPAPAVPPTAEPTPPPEPSATPAAETAGRAPWVLLPQPAPGSKVTPGQVSVEARGRGDAAIAEIRLELDGAALSTSLEQRSDSIWRGAANARVGTGQHSVKATVIDDRGRTGSFRWTFEARP